MATPFTCFLVAVASVAAAYSSMAMPGNAWADDIIEVAPVPAELMQWHSGLTGTSNACVIPEGKRPHAATQTEDAAAYLVMHGAVGLRHVGLDGSDFWFNSFDALNGARKPARNPGANQGVFQEIAD